MTPKPTAEWLAKRLVWLNDRPYDNDRADERNEEFRQVALRLAAAVLAITVEERETSR